MSRVSRITRACTMLAGAASFVTTVFVLDLGCGGGTFGAPADAGDASDATSFRHPKFDDLPPEEDAPYIPPRPSRVPDGWDLYTDYYPGCSIYVPSSKSYLPPRIQWDPCSTIVTDAGMPGPEGLVCRRMVTDWEPWGVFHTGPLMPTYTTEDGRVVIMLRRLIGNSIYDLVADADGPVHQAFLEYGPCMLGWSDVNGGMSIWPVTDQPDDDSHLGGAIGGPIDELRPRVVVPHGTKPKLGFAPRYASGPGMFVKQSGDMELYSFASGALITQVPKTPDYNDVGYGWFRFQGDDLFIELTSAARTLVRVWDATHGVRDLIGHGIDSSQQSAAFGTDGVDMVWIESFGRTDFSKLEWPHHETWTAKYSTDITVVTAQKRRLRSEYPGSEIERNVVGCGYAAHGIRRPSSWGNAYGIRVLRLTDGASWELVEESEDQHQLFGLSRPLGITCDEVFVDGNKLSDNQLFRIRLDSLGPPIPAD